MISRGDVLPNSCAPRGLNRTQAAAYIGVSASLFDEMVKDGRMPAPKRINARTVWDWMALDEAFTALPDSANENPWDAALGQGNGNDPAKAPH
jgi:predicted DNA-binding transcriptional regulator AlpA